MSDKSIVNEISETDLPEKVKDELSFAGITTVDELLNLHIREIAQRTKLSSFYLSIIERFKTRFRHQINPLKTIVEGYVGKEAQRDLDKIENVSANLEDTPIFQLDLSDKAYNALRLNGFETIKEIAYMDVQELKELPYFNLRIAKEVAFSCKELLRESNNKQSVKVESTENDEKDDSNNGSEFQGKAYNIVSYTEKQELVSDKQREEINKLPPVPIERMQLSVRSYNALKRANIQTVQDLAKLTIEDIKMIRNLGSKSIDEIINAVENFVIEENLQEYSSTPDGNEEKEQEQMAETVLDDRPITVFNLSVRSYRCLKNSGIDTVQQLLALSAKDIMSMRGMGQKSASEILTIQRNYTPLVPIPEKTEYSTEEVKELVLNSFTQPFKGLSFKEIRAYVPELVSDEEVKKSVGILLSEKKLEYVDFRCYKVYPSFYEYLEKYLATVPERVREIMTRRYAGETLEAIAKDFNIQRERVRQIQAKHQRVLHEKFKASFPNDAFDEDFYEPLFTKYALPEAFWKEELNLSQSSLKYLKETYKQGAEDPEKAIGDEEIYVSLRYRVRSFLDRDKVHIDGILFPKIRNELVKYALKKFAQDEITYDRFAEMYNQMLKDNDVPYDESLYLSENYKRYFTDRLSGLENCLWKQGERLRWYDIDARDYTELLETLNLESYQNTEISTRKFMDIYPNLMVKYDIRDPHELHNLLKKISLQYGLDYITFVRQPILRFGEFDRDKTIRETKMALSPVTQQDLIEYLYLEYGYDRGTAVNYLTSLSTYYHNGVYSIDFKSIPEWRVSPLQSLLTDDFYFIDEIKKIYLDSFKDADPEEINPYSLKSIGFIVYSNYVIQNYDTAVAYFTNLLTKQDVYDVGPMQKRYGTIKMFIQLFYEFLAKHIIFRYEQNQIITMKRLSRIGITEDDILDYIVSVRNFVAPDTYFTISSIRNEGFEHRLNDLGFGDYFYSSLLRADEGFAVQRVYGEIVIYNGTVSGEFSKADFFVDQLREYGSVDIDDFIQDIKDQFGITITDRYDVIDASRGAGMYYDPIMNKIYCDKSRYYAEFDD